jgi:transposase
MLFSGIDLHKRSIAIHTLDAEGTVLRAATLPAQHRALMGYFGTLPGPHRAVVECTGMWYWVRDLLVPQGIDLRLGHAKYLKAISYAKVKTDGRRRGHARAAPARRSDSRGAHGQPRAPRNP